MKFQNKYRVKTDYSLYYAEVKYWWFPFTWFKIGKLFLGLKYTLNFLAERENGSYKKPANDGKVIWTGTKENLPKPISKL